MSKTLLKCEINFKNPSINPKTKERILKEILEDTISVINYYASRLKVVKENPSILKTISYSVFNDNKGFRIFVDKKLYESLYLMYSPKDHFLAMLKEKNMPVLYKYFVVCKFHFINNEKGIKIKFKYYIK